MAARARSLFDRYSAGARVFVTRSHSSTQVVRWSPKWSSPRTHIISRTWPIVPLDIDGSGRRNWAIGLGDGTILVFSPDGEELARHATGERLRTILTLPQTNGPDLLVAATHRGLSAWRPVADRMRGPR